MKIAVISSTVFPCPPPGYSGLEQLAWLQAKGLAEKGHEVYLVAPDGSTCPGVRVVATGPPGRWDEKAAYGGFRYPTGRKVLNEHGQEVDEAVTVPAYWPLLLEVDAVIDNSWAKWAYVLKAEGRMKAPVLGVMHAPVNTMYQSLPPGVDRPCFVCISRDQTAHFDALFSPVTARTCHNGVDPDFYRRIPGVRRSDRFLFLARFSSIKGADLALEACRRAGVGLDLVGDTSITNEPQYFEYCKSLCDGERLRMVGPATRGECVHWFSRAYCMLHPNQRFREPFGLAPVEALLCGCPVLAWDYGAMRETVGGLGDYWLVDSVDELAERVKGLAAADGPFAHDLAGEDGFRARCREYAERFSVRNMVDRYDELVREAVDGGGW